ncbi:MAG: metal-dependent hydrolase [Methanobacteriaceae archaeon]|nr:metal-dependent hydrolase [Methanobacteriaceae archaeon]
MSSYKKHVLFSLLFTIPFFQEVFLLALAVVGTSIIDIDHNIKRKNRNIILIVGLLLSLILYMLKLPFLIGILLVLIVLILYFSKHRGFTHSLFGIFVLSILLTAFVLGAYFLLKDFNVDNRITLMIIAVFIGVLSLNKRIMPIYIILAVLGIYFLPVANITLYGTFLALFLGFISHLTLDLLTPKGLELFRPVSSRKCKKKYGVLFLVIWGIFVFIRLYTYLKVILY